MRFWRRLRFRLFASHVVVVVIGGLATLAVAGWLTRSLFENRIRGFGRGPGALGARTTAVLEEYLSDSLNTAFAIGILVGIVAAAAVAALAGRRLIRPIDAVRTAAHRMAEGDYAHRIPVPDEQELAALAADVNTLGNSLRRTEHRRTTLMAEVTHELRSPLTTINGYLEGLIDGVVEPTDEVLAGMAAETARIQRLTEDLTLLSRAEEGTLTLRLEPVDLAAVVIADVERLRPQYDHAGVALEIDTQPGIVVEVDPGRMAQVMTNLLGNALTHTDRGGTVSITTTRNDRIATMEVSDTGPGIPSDQLNRIFDRFFRIPDARHPAGRGIGLTIARSIVRAHGGDIVAGNRSSRSGAVFTVTLPVTSARSNLPVSRR